MGRHSSGSHHHSSSSSSRHHSSGNDRNRRRSRSRSNPRLFTRVPEKTRREFEIEVEALQEENRELRMQMEHFRAQITQVSLAQVQAESRAAHWEHEAHRINISYKECSNVLMALRQGVDDLERQKQQYINEASTAQKERDIADMASQNFRQQMETASDRNIALVKKCESYVEENKALKEKITSCETELKELRPALAKLEAQLDEAQRTSKAYGDENMVLRDKEKIWNTEKKDLEKKLLIKDALAAVERKNKGNESVTSISSEDTGGGVDMERIARLEMVIDSLHAHYENRLKMLEELCDVEGDEEPSLCEPEAAEMLSKQLHDATTAILAESEETSFVDLGTSTDSDVMIIS